jgi:cytochrome c2
MNSFLKKSGKYLSVIALSGLVSASFLLTGYTDTANEISNLPDSLELNPFVEPGFPFISTSIDARKLGNGFPADNMAGRTLALQLADSTYACFDTDLLRWSVAWTGKFLPMVSLAQVSYKDFFNKNNQVTTLTGTPLMATGSYAGWTSGKPVFQSPGAYVPTWHPLPAEKARWNGVYVFDNKAILNYSVGTTDISEMPGSTVFDNQTVFTRTFQIDKTQDALFLTAAEITNATFSEVKNGIAYIYQGANRNTVTAVGISGKGKSVLRAEVRDNRYITVQVPAGSGEISASVAIWKGPARMKSKFEKLSRKIQITLPEFKKGGPTQWKETVVTRGQLSPDTAAFVTDLLALPLHNPWKRNVRVADISFFKDGRAAVVTFDGDVWLIEGIDKDLKKITWRRFASGLHEPMSIEVVNEKVHVFGREGIVRLNDLNNDGMADFYENFSNIMGQSSESREWAADMVGASDGSFYIAKGASLGNGPGVTAKLDKWFRAGSDENGTILKISPDGRKSEVIATGLRGPYLGFNPEKDILTSTDQQGNYVPSSPIYVVKKGDYFGVSPTSHRKDNPAITPPLTWIPHRVDRSSLGEAWITGNKMGPLNGSLIHFSFGRPGLFRVLFDSTSAVLQGGVSVIRGTYPAPTSKGAMNPVDEQLYVTGFNLWGSSAPGISALVRLRYTGKPSYMPQMIRAGKEGIILGFDSKLDAATALDLGNFRVKRWNYKRTEEYGSGHYKTDGTTGEETLPVNASYLSADGNKILLLVPDMKEVMQMEVVYQLKSKDGQPMDDQFWFTVNSAGALNPAQYGFKNVDLSLLKIERKEPVVVKKEELPTAEKGKELFHKMACIACHSEGLKTDGMYGPPFQNLYKSERHFADGTRAIADEKYLKESILSPALKIVKGYSEEMPSFLGVLTDADIESIILHIKSLPKK